MPLRASSGQKGEWLQGWDVGAGPPADAGGASGETPPARPVSASPGPGLRTDRRVERDRGRMAAPPLAEDPTEVRSVPIPWDRPVGPFPSVPPVAPPADRPTARPRAIRPSRRARPLLPDAPALFPWLSARFSDGEATLWSGPPGVTEVLLRDVFAGVAAAGGRVSLLEGANRFDPYRVVERGRALGVPPDELLERIRLARAFTVHQMVALADGWAAEVRRHRPTLLVAHELPALFDDPDVDPEERAPLLAAAAEGLRRAAESVRLPLLVTSARGLPGFPGLAERGPRLFDFLRLRPAPGRVVLTSHRVRDRLALVARPDGQVGLEAFGAAPRGEEVIRWDAPSRPTGRRWRSG